MMINLFPIAAIPVLFVVLEAPVEVPSTDSLMVLRQGPRTGPNGKKFLNIQGKNSGEGGKYASYCLLDFLPEKMDVKGGKSVKSVSLRLTQSIPRFAKDGRFQVALIPEDVKPIDPEKNFDAKFEEGSDSGLGSLFKNMKVLGTFTFKSMATGQVDLVGLKLADEETAFLLKQVEKGGRIRLVLTPLQDEVAACYFGAGSEKVDDHPRLVIDWK